LLFSLDCLSIYASAWANFNEKIDNFVVAVVVVVVAVVVTLTIDRNKYVMSHTT
jgi:hypothetical protein